MLPAKAGFKFKEGENVALTVSADASLRVTKVPKFEPDTGTLVKL